MTPDDYIPNQWYPIFDSSKLRRRKPVGITRLGERLVLWRDSSGAVVCMADRCPHRAAQLSLGWVRDDCLVCPFHGLRFDSDGRCVLIPANGEGQPVPRGFDLQPHHVREEHGLIWYWFGDSQPASEIPWFPEAPEPGPRANIVQHDYPVSYLRVMENLGDMHHVPFVHQGYNPGRGHSRRDAGGAARRRDRSTESLAASRTTGLDAAYLQLHFRHAASHPCDDHGRQGSAVCSQRDAYRSRPYLAVGAIWSGLCSRMARRQKCRMADSQVRSRVGVHESGHADARKPTAQ